MRRDEGLANDIASLSDLNTMSLRQRWAELFDIEPATRISRDLLIRAIAWRMQEKAHGGLSKAAQHQLARHADEFRSLGSMSVSSGADYKPGTKLIREWQGKVHEVVILDDGYIWSGKKYRSLSEIARGITGTRWSGPRFFGTEAPRRAPALAGPDPDLSELRSVTAAAMNADSAQAANLDGLRKTKAERGSGHD